MAEQSSDGLELARSVLRHANHAHGVAFSLVRRLPGGYQTGAHELASPSGRRAVLKWWPRPRSIEAVQETVAVLEMARSAGWPTPKWLYYGVDPEGRPYEIQEFVEGQHRDGLEAETLGLLLDVNRLQADLPLATTHDWSVWATDVVFGNHDRLRAQVCDSSTEGRELDQAIERVCSHAGDVRLPTTDLVCGVFALENILFGQHHVAGVIDVEAAGKGTRAYDLAVLYSRLLEYEPSSPLEAVLREAGANVAGVGVFAVCLAAEFLGVLAFGLTAFPSRVGNMSALAAHSLDGLFAPGRFGGSPVG